MAAYQLVRQTIKHVVHGEVPFFARHLGIEQDLQEQVTQFSREFRPVTILYGFENLIGFFERIAFDGVKGLLSIPWTTSRSSQLGHDFDHTLESLPSGRHAV